MDNFGAFDRAMMARALELAGKGLYSTTPNPRVGCVLVQGETIVGEGWHEKTGGPHAEAVAIGQAGARAAGATLYVNLEPCSHQGRTPPCVDLILDKKISRVVAAILDPNSKAARGGEKLAAADDAGHCFGMHRVDEINEHRRQWNDSLTHEACA